MRHLNIAILAFSCAGCAGVGGGRPASVAQSDSLSIEYNLPVTTARVSMELVLVSCSNEGLRARPTVTVQPVSNANNDPEERFRLHSTALSSWTRNRQLTVELHPHGALRSVNGGTADRTGAIVTNLLKTALSVVPLFDASSQAATACNEPTMRALRQVAALEARITTLRAALAQALPAQAATLREAIDALAAEAARLRTEHLLITLTKEVDIRVDEAGGAQRTIAWTQGDLARWLPAGMPADHSASNFRLTYCLRRADDRDAGVCPIIPPPPQLPERPPQPERANCLPGCPRTIVLREPVNATMTVVATAGDFVRLVPGQGAVPIPARARLQRATVPVAQWGRLSYIPLRAGFGESNSFALGLDEFGRRGSFTWKADARAEGITGSVASIADAGARLEVGIRGQDLADQTAEINRLQTQQNLNRLRFCREVIEAGGFTCPTG